MGLQDLRLGGADMSQDKRPLATIRVRPPSDYSEFQKTSGLPGVIAEIACHRSSIVGRNAAEWLSSNSPISEKPCGFRSHMESVAEAALAAIRKAQERFVAVFSDYDVDGCTSSTIIADTLSTHIGANYSQIPARRHEDGFGFTMTAAKKIVDSKCSMIFVLDCGTVDYKSIKLCHDAGVTVVVIDHHRPKSNHDELWPASNEFAHLVNPKVSDDPGPFDCMCTAGLALNFAYIMAKIAGNVPTDQQLFDLTEMAAVGTICDMAHLELPNRGIVRHGLQGLARTKRKGVKKLLSLFKVDGAPSSTNVSWKLGPAINSPGRLGSASTSLQVLSSVPMVESEAAADECFSINVERKTKTDWSMAEAMSDVAQLEDVSKAIVVGRPEWNSGVVGLIAGRLMNEYGVPTFVYGSGNIGSGLMKGSCRAPEGQDVHAILEQCAKAGVLDKEKIGGHKAAGGFSVHPSKVDEFKAAVISAAAAAGGSSGFTLEVDAELDPSVVTVKFARDFKKLEPFGQGNPEPIFIGRKLLLDSMESFGPSKNHTRLYVFSIKGFIQELTVMTWWRKLPSETGLTPGRPFDAIYRVSLVNWRKRDEAQLTIEAVIDESGRVIR